MTTPTQPQTQARSIHDLYTFYLSPAHLDDGKQYELTIEQAVIKPVFSQQLNKDVDELVIHFKDARRSLKCNKTQAESLWDILGTDDHTKWAECKIVLERVPTKRGGKFTIKISKPTE